jgi:hypothetical protein
MQTPNIALIYFENYTFKSICIFLKYNKHFISNVWFTNYLIWFDILHKGIFKIAFNYLQFAEIVFCEIRVIADWEKPQKTGAILFVSIVCNYLFSIWRAFKS